MNGLTTTETNYDLNNPAQCESCGVLSPGIEPHAPRCQHSLVDAVELVVKRTPSEQAAASRAARLDSGTQRVEVILSEKAATKLEKLVALHGSKRAAIEAAILSM